MKKIPSNFADSLISRDQMKSIKGGYVGESVTCKDENQEVIGYTTADHCIDAFCECNARYGSQAQYATCY